ncbi:ATP-dependent DNA ligase [Nocardia puris]|nr:RNA ligase family protein [Nocardia puris]
MMVRVPAPMLASPGTLPSASPIWAFEMKWDGQRAIARCDETGCRLWSRNLREATGSYPDLAAALAETTADLGDGLLLDGEIVAPDPDTGAPSFARLQRRMHTRPTRALLDEIRVEFVVFDLLAVDGVSTMDQPYLARRALLDRLAVERGRVRVPPFWTDFDPSHLLDAAEQAGLEGVVAKRTDSVYRPGTRTRAWIKSPIRRSAEGIVAAWIEGTGAHSGTVGSLVLAAYDVGSEGYQNVRNGLVFIRFGRLPGTLAGR